MKMSGVATVAVPSMPSSEGRGDSNSCAPYCSTKDVPKAMKMENKGKKAATSERCEGKGSSSYPSSESRGNECQEEAVKVNRGNNISDPSSSNSRTCGTRAMPRCSNFFRAYNCDAVPPQQQQQHSLVEKPMMNRMKVCTGGKCKKGITAPKSILCKCADESPLNWCRIRLCCLHSGSGWYLWRQ